VRVERPEVITSSVFIMTNTSTESESADSGSGESPILIGGAVLEDTNASGLNYSPVQSTNESVVYNTEEESNITQGNQQRQVLGSSIRPPYQMKKSTLATITPTYLYLKKLLDYLVSIS